jgi:PAS domain S-box-containing protein
MHEDVSHSIVDEPSPWLNVIDSIPALVAYIDCNMHLRFCNHPFREWFGLDDEIVVKSFPVIVGEDAFNQIQAQLGKVLFGNKAHFQLSVDNGSSYLEATLCPDFDARGNVKGFVFHASDITEKNKAEIALSDYVENASVGLHWVDANGIIIWANPAELKLLGYDEHEYVGHHIAEFYADQNVIQDIQKQLSSTEALNYEADLICKDGSIRTVSINSAAFWERNKFVHTRYFTADITEQRTAAKALKESEERFRTMANLVPLIIWTTNPSGECNFLSVRWKEVTGKPVESGLGNLWLELVHPDDREQIKQSWRKSFAEKRKFEAKFRFQNGSNQYRATFAHSIPIFDAAERFCGYIGILQDISVEEHIRTSLEKMVLERTDDLRKRNYALQQTEKALHDKNEELEKINKQLASFAHIASHDLQEPLRKIQIFLQRLFTLEGGHFSEKGIQLYNQINDSSTRMRHLIRDLLSFSKSGFDEIQLQRVDLNHLLKGVIDELQVHISEKKAKIQVDHLPTLSVIEFQFHQLFLNLLSNALKFSRHGIEPVITVSSEILNAKDVPIKVHKNAKTYYHLSVTDNGIGFESQYSDKIFEMFSRLHGRQQYEGTGIGLAICKKIIDNHKGVIIAESKHNVGSTFHIYLPAS